MKKMEINYKQKEFIKIPQLKYNRYLNKKKKNEKNLI